MPASSRKFAQAVAEELKQGVLRFSSRQQLLSTAEQMGISRFQANLIIAALQHQFPPTSPTYQPQQFRWVPWLAVVLLFQGVIATCIYAFLLSH